MKSPNDIIKEVTFEATKGMTDNPETLSSSLRKNITIMAMSKYARYYSKYPCDLRKFEAKPLFTLFPDQDKVGY